MRDRYCGEHRRLERLAETLYAALEARDGARIDQVRELFAERFRSHLADEETNLVPLLRGVAGAAALCILEEHRHLRACFAEVHAGIEHHVATLGSVRAFIDALRAHVRVEDRILYRLTDESLVPFRARGEPVPAATASTEHPPSKGMR